MHSNTDKPLSRRSTIAGAIVPAALLLLGGLAGGLAGGCAGALRRESRGAEPEIPARRGGSAIRPDGTRVFRNHTLVDQDGRTVRFQEDLVGAACSRRPSSTRSATASAAT